MDSLPKSPTSVNTPLEDPIYSPLPLQTHLRETRVLYLENGEWDDLITCRLEVVALGNKPEYDALSYVWGSTTKVHPISLNGHAIQVHTSLWSALRHLRSSTETKALWADAICINQNSILERNDQVALMRDIYSMCKGVLIWLGDPPGSPGSTELEPVLETQHGSPCLWMTDFTQPRPRSGSHVAHKDDDTNITGFHDEITDYYRLPFALRHSLIIDHIMGAFCLISQLAQNKHITNTEIPLLGNHDAFHKIILCLGDLMTRPWWVRQWVIQEVVLPPTATIFFGRFVAPWDMFAHAARNYDYHRKTMSTSTATTSATSKTSPAPSSNSTTSAKNGKASCAAPPSPPAPEPPTPTPTRTTPKPSNNPPAQTRISLRHLLWKFRKRSTSDARDKVYALFPLVNDWGKHVAMYPEYGWTAQAIYRAVAEKIITVDESLLVLMGSTEKTLEGLPSWVPDWAKTPARFEVERLERTGLFNACGGRRVGVRFMGERVMEVKGVGFDVVSGVSETIKYDDEDETLRDFAAWYRLVYETQKGTEEYVAGGSRMEAYWRTLCIDTCRSLGQEEVELGVAMGSQYRRCSREYVRDCMALWMDHYGLPLGTSSRQTPEMMLANGDLDARPSGSNVDSNTGQNGSNGKRRTRAAKRSRGDLSPSPNGSNGGTDTRETKRARKNSELTNSDKLNFVAIDFAITSATIQRRLFLTSKGYIGIGPRNMAVGDRVYVFAGGHMPFMVRDVGVRDVPYVGKRACHELIGDCYVHGVMDGEVMDDPESQTENVYLV